MPELFLWSKNLGECILQVNTERVLVANKGMRHSEGGWPKEVDATEHQETSKWNIIASNKIVNSTNNGKICLRLYRAGIIDYNHQELVSTVGQEELLENASDVWKESAELDPKEQITSSFLQ